MADVVRKAVFSVEYRLSSVCDKGDCNMIRTGFRFMFRSGERTFRSGERTFSSGERTFTTAKHKTKACCQEMPSVLLGNCR